MSFGHAPFWHGPSPGGARRWPFVLAAVGVVTVMVWFLATRHDGGGSQAAGKGATQTTPARSSDRTAASTTPAHHDEADRRRTSGGDRRHGRRQRCAADDRADRSHAPLHRSGSERHVQPRGRLRPVEPGAGQGRHQPGRGHARPGRGHHLRRAPRHRRQRRPRRGRDSGGRAGGRRGRLGVGRRARRGPPAVEPPGPRQRPRDRESADARSGTCPRRQRRPAQPGRARAPTAGPIPSPATARRSSCPQGRWRRMPSVPATRSWPGRTRT